MASAIVFRTGRKTEIFSQAINLLLTGLHIHKGESIARGPRNALRQALGFVFARIDTQGSW